MQFPSSFENLEPLKPCLRRTFDAKRTQPRGWFFILDFDRINPSCPWPLAQSRVQSGELVTRALRQHFHAAIVIVANPSGNAQNVCFALDEPAEADTLHAPANEETTSLDWFFRGSHEKKLLIADFRLSD
jgi:hypothetical protein